MSACKCQDGAEERALCMDSKGPPRRVERTRRGIFTHAPVTQLEELPLSKQQVAGSSPAGRSIPFREVTK